jgi:hypothetical protein
MNIAVTIDDVGKDALASASEAGPLQSGLSLPTASDLPLSDIVCLRRCLPPMRCSSVRRRRSDRR